MINIDEGRLLEMEKERPPTVVEVETRSGAPIFVQVRETVTEQRESRKAGKDPLDRLPERSEIVGAREELAGAIEGVKNLVDEAAGLVGAVRERHAPSEISVELNIGFTGKATPIPFLVGAEAEAALKVTVKRKSPSGAP